MASQVLADLSVAVANTVGVMESAVVFINGEAARLQAAINAALANGATATELAPVQDEVNALVAKSGELAAAIAANPNPNPATPDSRRR